MNTTRQDVGSHPKDTLQVDEVAASSARTAMSSINDDEPAVYDTKGLFQKARILLNPSALFRGMTYLYAERKLMVFFLVHLVATLVIWGKFDVTYFRKRKLDT